MPEWTHQVDMGMMSPAQASVAQLDRVLGYEPSGRRFESSRMHHLLLNNSETVVSWSAR